MNAGARGKGKLARLFVPYTFSYNCTHFPRRILLLLPPHPHPHPPKKMFLNDGEGRALNHPLKRFGLIKTEKKQFYIAANKDSI